MRAELEEYDALRHGRMEVGGSSRSMACRDY